MADQADVENVLTQLVSAALYPAGVLTTSVPGPTCRVYRGWPNSGALDADLKSGRINVTIFPVEMRLAETTRYPALWTAVASKSPTLTATVNGNSATFEGTAGPGQLAGLLVDGSTYVYRTQQGDTPDLVAANLATLVRADRIAFQTKASVSVPGARDFLARTVTDAGVVMELRRQEQVFRISSWCPDPALRDVTATAIDNILADLRFIDLPDATKGRIRFAGSTVFDQSQNAALYRRDLLYSVEYATTRSTIQPSMLFSTGTVNDESFKS